MAAKTAPIQPFEATPLDVISSSISQLRATYNSLRTKDIQFRLKQLRKLYWGIVDYTPQLEEAILKDLHKGTHETTITEIAWSKNECLDLINNLEKWAKDEPVVNVPAAFWAMGHRIRHEPLGVILVIGAFNYPVQLALVPAIGAIAAGNAVLLKPSEGAPHTAMVLQRIFEEYLDPESYFCVNGALPESQAILDHKFDKIVFTGSRSVGKIIARKAAETLTPTLLELGGQNPAFISKHADIKLAARRLMWAKCLNAGQVCLSQNYALVERSVLSQFIGELHNSYRTFMPQGAKASPDYCRINNKANFDRLKKMLDSSKGKIVLGGSMDEADLFIEPTVVLVDDVEDSLIIEETFGPIWTVMAWDSLDWAIDVANKVDPTPLSLFTFGNDAENDRGSCIGLSLSPIYSHSFELQHSNTLYSTPQCYLRRRHRQRCLFSCITDLGALWRCWAVWQWYLPRLLLLQGIQPPAHRCPGSRLDGRPSPCPLHALCSLRSQALHAHVGQEAQL